MTVQKYLLLVVFVLAASTFAVATAWAAQSNRTVSGALIDAKCLKSIQAAEDPDMTVKDHHEISCTLGADGIRSGLVIMTGKRVTKIDPASNSVVIAFLRGPQANQFVLASGRDGPNGFVVQSLRPMRQE